MNDKGKKIIIIGVLIIIIIVIIVVLSINTNSNDKDPNSGITYPEKEIKISKNIERLNDKKIFDFETSINNYLNKDVEFDSNNYTIKSIYYNPSSDVTYYFINGYLIISTGMDMFSDYKPNVNYLLIEKQNLYELRELDNSIDIFTIANSYDIRDIEINSNLTYTTTNVLEHNKLSIYIEKFLMLLFVDSDKAYKMLNNDTKNKYNDYYDFKSDITNIYNSLNSTIYSYSKLNNTYTVKLKNDSRIDIIENYIGDYEVSF